MEHFEGPHRKVKEKNMYILHLDTARIVLVSAAVIGIIVASFLLGMNYLNYQGKNDSSLAFNDPLDSKKEMDLLKSNIPSLNNEDDVSKPLEEKFDIIDKNNDTSKTENKKDYNSLTKNESVDLLTNENINEDLPPLKKDRKIKNISKSESKKKSSKKVARSTKKSEKKRNSRKKREKKKNIIEVSSSHTKSVRRSGSAGYSIQVASFDKKSKARAEARLLKNKSYDAHVDQSTVRGRRYYRVKVGPIRSKRKAIRLLNNIQEIDRYQNSYMIKE